MASRSKSDVGERGEAVSLASVMASVRAAGKASHAKTYRRLGVREETFGVPYADFAKLHKKLKVDHELALELWDTAIHDARVLATKIAAPDRMSRKAIARWLDAAGNSVIVGAVAEVAARMRDAAQLAEEWSQRDDEWAAAAGWSVFALLAANGELGVAQGRKLIGRVRRGIGAAKNRERYSMNSALIAIGGTMPELRDEALAAARAIGVVEVDHGDTDCKTPDAVEYIARMAGRAAKTRATGACKAKGAVGRKAKSTKSKKRSGRARA